MPARASVWMQSPAHMDRSAARHLMTRFFGRSTRVRARAGDLARQLASLAGGKCIKLI